MPSRPVHVREHQRRVPHGQQKIDVDDYYRQQELARGPPPGAAELGPREEVDQIEAAARARGQMTDKEHYRHEQLGDRLVAEHNAQSLWGKLDQTYREHWLGPIAGVSDRSYATMAYSKLPADVRERLIETSHLADRPDKPAKRPRKTQAKRTYSKPQKSLKEQMMAELHGAWCDFDYEKYRRTKLYMERHKLIDDSNRGMVKRFEAHPTFGKSFGEHQRWVKARERKEAQQYQRDMKNDARAGRHFKYASVWNGRLCFDSEYQQVCRDLKVKLPIGERYEEDDAALLAALEQSHTRV